MSCGVGSSYALFLAENPVSLRQLWLSVLTMPLQLRWLCIAQLFGFVGMETILLWYTDLMGRVVYNGDPQVSLLFILGVV